MRNFFRRTLAWALLCTAYLSAQTTGSISGTVVDSSGALIVGTKVRATSTALLSPQVSETSQAGLYRFATLPPGTYRISYEKEGFGTVVREGVVVAIGVADTLDISMSLGTQLQTVVVQGDAPLVDTLNTNLQNTVTTQQLRNLPNARDVWSLIAAQPGLSVTRFDVGGSTAGTQTTYTSYGLRDQNRVQIDGANTTEGTGSAGFYFDYGAFQEFQLGTAANDASMPTPGVFVNAIIKSGSNQFHGEMYGDYESDSLESTNVSKAQLLSGAGLGTRILNYRDLNGQIGGPIKKDRVWFFVSLRDQDVKTTVTGFPVGAPPTQVFPFETRLQNITYKISGQINARNRLSTFLEWGRKYQPSRNAASNYYPDAVYTQNSFSWAGNLEWSGTITPKLFMIARFITFAYDWPNKPFINPDIKAVDFRRQELQTGNLKGGFDPYRYNRRRYGGEATGSYFLDNFLGVNHDLKFGWNSEREALFYEQDGVRGNTLLVFNSAAGAQDFTTPYQVGITNEPAALRDQIWHHGLYLQDQIKVNRHIAINAGIRWDYYKASEPQQKIRPDAPFRDFFYAGAALPTSAGPYSIPAKFPDFTIPGRDVVSFPHQFVPRLGVAYDLQGNGKTVIKANWGLFYSNPGTALGSDVNQIQKTTYLFGWNDVNKDGLFQPNELGAFASSSGGSNFTVGKKFRDPLTTDTSVFMERQIREDLSIRAGFVYKKVSHDWQLVDVARPASLFSQQKYFCDPGPTGLSTCADGKGITSIFDIPSGIAVPASRGEYQTPDGNTRDFKNLEFTVNKRFSHRFTAVANFYYNWENSLVTTDGYAAGNGTASQAALPAYEFSYANGIATNPNVAVNNKFHVTNWATKVNGTYQARWGIMITPAYRGQSGQPQSRIVQVASAALTPGGPATALRAGGFRYAVDPWGTYRQDNIHIFDARLEKTFTFRERFKFSAILDAFNILNSNGNQGQDNITGRRTAVLPDGTKNSYQRFLSPTTVIGPRIFRIGGRFMF